MTPNPSISVEESGWSRIDISVSALDNIEKKLPANLVEVVPVDLRFHAAGHNLHLCLPDYAGHYRIYGGEMYHCLLEKSLEHYLSFIFAEPAERKVAVDIGSCKSVVPEILRRVYGVTCYEQDLEYPPGVNGWRIGSSADAIPLPDTSVDFMMLHCTFEHFEGNADTGFVRECGRLLRPGGRAIILPLYLNPIHCNVTGETQPERRHTIGFDPEAAHRCLIPEWQNRFGRHYSPEALTRRVLQPASESGLTSTLLRVKHWEAIDPRLWLKWILILRKPD